MCYLVYNRVKFLALCYKLCFQITFFFHLLFFISHPLPYLTLPITRQRQGLLSRRMVVSPEMRSVLNSLLLSVASCSKYSPSSLVCCCLRSRSLACSDWCVTLWESDFVFISDENTKYLVSHSIYSQSSSPKTFKSLLLKDIEI